MKLPDQKISNSSRFFTPHIVKSVTSLSPNGYLCLASNELVFVSSSHPFLLASAFPSRLSYQGIKKQIKTRHKKRGCNTHILIGPFFKSWCFSFFFLSSHRLGKEYLTSRWKSCKISIVAFRNMIGRENKMEGDIQF